MRCDDRPVNVVAAHLLKALGAVVAPVFCAWGGCGVERGESSLGVCVQDDADGVAEEVAKGLLKRGVVAYVDA